MRIEFNHNLLPHNTFRMKVLCECFVEYDSIKELAGINFDALPRPFLHIGEGSNLLFTKDFPGTVFHSRIDYVKYFDMGLDDVIVAAGSGTNFDRFVSNTTANGMWGAENLSLIPGEVGAAAVQNIGAYGVEFKDITRAVTCFDLRDRQKVSFKVEECNYGYRSSMFKDPELKGRYIITGVMFRLSRVPLPKIEYKGLREQLLSMGYLPDTVAPANVRPEASVQDAESASAATLTGLTPAAVRDAVIAIRKLKLPDPADLGSAGSFFKNPVVSAEEFARISPDGNAPHFTLPDGSVKVPAAWLIDSCGLKGASRGGAEVYQKQPLVIVNRSGDATPADVLALERHIIDSVRTRYGITLHPEVEHI